MKIVNNIKKHFEILNFEENMNIETATKIIKNHYPNAEFQEDVVYGPILHSFFYKDKDENKIILDETGYDLIYQIIKYKNKGEVEEIKNSELLNEIQKYLKDFDINPNWINKISIIIDANKKILNGRNIKYIAKYVANKIINPDKKEKPTISSRLNNLQTISIAQITKYEK